MKYSGRNLSIVFQGPNFCGSSDAPSTLECIRRTREAYPDAEIIFSTWAEVSEIRRVVDKFIINIDPGPLENAQSAVNYLVNINRQIISTRAGLFAAQRQLAVKIRCDSFLTYVDLGRMFDEYRIEGRSIEYFDAPILLSAFGCVNPVRWPALFFVSDFFHFGLTSDLRRLWSIRLCPRDYGTYHHRFPIAAWRVASSPGHFERFAPEQYVWTAFLSEQGMNVSLEATLDYSPSNYRTSEYMFAGHFVPLPSDKLGLHLPGRFTRTEARRTTVYRDDWQELRSAFINDRFDAWLDGRLRKYLVANLVAFTRYHFAILLRPFVLLGSRVKRSLAP